MGQIIIADAVDGLRQIESESCDTCVTSPPYFQQRNYGVDGQIGLEDTPEAFISRIVDVFREVKRVLRNDGTLWVVISDSYAGSGKNAGNKKPHPKARKGLEHSGDTLPRYKIKNYKPKDLIGIPWMLAFALRDDGWYLRQDIIWNKPNCMPESVTDRCTKSHEYIFLLSKSKRYYYDSDAIKEPAKYDGRKDTYNKGSIKYDVPCVPGKTVQTQNVAGKPHERWIFKDGFAIKNKRDVWTIATKPYKKAHFAVFPPELIRPCIRAGSRRGGIVLDPFAGSGTTAKVAVEEGRDFICIDINPQYRKLIEQKVGG